MTEPTDAECEALADEAEAGYDVEMLKTRPNLLDDPEYRLRRAGFLTVAPPAAPPIGWSSHDPDID